ncbi:MAG TPA: hypothetical protein VJ726_13115 [Candidatus Limnocylindria bacterium]|nr:hypothetical protein [Candidatus Limnocylindria bacterium]
MRARAEVGQAFQYALIIFTLTVLLGLANASQLFGALDRATLLTHLHSGTLGWITMGVIGIAIWMFARRNEDLSAAILLSGLGTAAYVMAFWSGVFILRGVFGLAELAIIVYWWWFVYTRVMAEGGIARLDIPKLSVLLGLTTLVIGSTLGVIVQVLLATGNALPTGADLVGAHASAQTGGYLVLVAAGFAEWQLIGGSGRTRLGLAQVYLLFIGGLVLSASLLLSSSLPAAAAQALPGLATLLTLAGILIAAYRVGRAALAAPWLAPTGARHIAIVVPFLILAVILQAILVQQFIAAQGDFTLVSIGLLHALDHAYFVGVMTNAIFGAILIVNSERGTTTLSKVPERARVWPWADDVIFWGLNVGAAAFIAVLIIVGSGEGKPAFTHPVAFVAPIMGLAALLGIVTYLVRMLGMPAVLTRRARA